MEKIMRILTPRSALAAGIRAAFFIAIIALANVTFSFLYYSGEVHDPAYYVMHAAFVGGPFVAFFFAVMMFQVKLQRRLWQISRKDGLTGLNNRNTFLALTTQHQQTTTSGVLLLLDADRFKEINDVHGHQTGDNCLKSIAKTLKSNLRENDIVGRIGGEEFAIFLSEIPLNQAKLIAKRFTQPIPFKSAVDGQIHSVTLSVGAVAARPGLTLDELIAQADQGLYIAKANGRACLVVWDEVATEHGGAVH